MMDVWVVYTTNTLNGMVSIWGVFDDWESAELAMKEKTDDIRVAEAERFILNDLQS